MFSLFLSVFASFLIFQFIFPPSFAFFLLYIFLAPFPLYPTLSFFQSNFHHFLILFLLILSSLASFFPSIFQSSVFFSLLFLIRFPPPFLLAFLPCSFLYTLSWFLCSFVLYYFSYILHCLLQSPLSVFPSSCNNSWLNFFFFRLLTSTLPPSLTQPFHISCMLHPYIFV